MRKVPPGVHRERDGEDRPAIWYVVWLGVPHAEGSVILGRSRRLPRKRAGHRFFPALTAEWPQVYPAWVDGVWWLYGLYEGQEKTSDQCRAAEAESVRCP